MQEFCHNEDAIQARGCTYRSHSITFADPNALGFIHRFARLPTKDRLENTRFAAVMADAHPSVRYIGVRQTTH